MGRTYNWMEKNGDLWHFTMKGEDGKGTGFQVRRNGVRYEVIPEENEEKDGIENDLNAVRRELSYEERLAALAEECSELGQAALKLRRCLDGENFTPKDERECRDALEEEIGDVVNCFLALGVPFAENPEKIHRWAERLRYRYEPIY